MPITTAMTNQAKLDFLGGVHLPTHEYKLALYTDTPTLGAGTTAYQTTGEVVGTNYLAGGKVLTGYARALDGNVAYINWADLVFLALTVTGIRGCIVYNNTLVGKQALSVHDFGAAHSPNGVDFTVDIGASTGAAAAVRIG